jgi:hypothetical protein
MNTTLFEEQLDTVRELNRAFLLSLRHDVRSATATVGLPREVGALLRSAPPPILDALAEFPGALFRLDLTRCEPPAAVGDGTSDADYHLASSILHAVRGVARQSAYCAQVLFGLMPAEVERCRSLTFDELRRLACSPHLLRCAHAQRPWLWHALLRAVRPESRRHLTLMALQPDVPQGWPARRPPQATR